MFLNILFPILIILGTFDVILGQSESLSCVYSMSFDYTCTLTIKNPSGFNNFTAINGIHLTGKTDEDVRRIDPASGSNSTNVPSIICEKFKNLQRIDLQSIGIETVDENSFKSCKALVDLYLGYNRIRKIHERSFSENLELYHLELWSNELTVLPEKLFLNQQKLSYFRLSANKFTDFPDNIFKPLKGLTDFSLRGNKITNLKNAWFETLENLVFLFIYENQIKELPRDVFKPLKKLYQLSTQMNNLTIIHSRSFGNHSNLKLIHLYDNQINAIDEKVIDNTAVITIDLTRNICANSSISDSTSSRQSMRTALKKCFENYEKIMSGCVNGNLDERVCHIEGEVGDLREEKLELQEKVEILAKEKEELQRSFDEHVKNTAAALEELENKILLLSANPCTCQ